MLYNLNKQSDRDKMQERIVKLLDKCATVDLTEKKPNRTLPQNNYLHLILSYFAIEHGYTLEEVKRDYFKILCNKELFVETKKHDSIGEYLYLKSSADIDTKQMTIAIDRFKNWSAENGLRLPEADDFHLLNMIRNEIEQNKEYL